MIDDLLHDLQILRKADTLIGRIWLHLLVRRVGLMAFAALVAIFGLGMANLAGFFLLQPAVGSVGAAAISGIGNLLLAVILMLVARSAKPGAELEMALDVHQMALDAIRAGARDLQATVDEIGHELRTVKQTLSDAMHNPLDMAAQKLLIPAALSIIRWIRSKKPEG
jgi:hypothetical protein